VRLTSLRVQNYRSVVDSGEIRIEPLQALVGENNCGKSNLLRAIQVFLTAGAGGVTEADFFDPAMPIIITSSFSGLSQHERRLFRLYLLGDKLILEKRIVLDQDSRSQKQKAKAEYHGYQSRPKDWWLSVDGVLDHTGTNRPNWEQIAQENGVLDYVRDEVERVNKASYEAGTKRIVLEREDIEFDVPQLGQTQVLGLQPVLLDSLPLFRLLPAITDYSDEIDRRASQTSFRLLMADLAERALARDPRFTEVERALQLLSRLLNPPLPTEVRTDGEQRLTVIESVESRLTMLMSRLMPAVTGVRFTVQIEEIGELFSRGVTILIDDGKLTEVLMKGHGMQRCVVFALIQSLVLSQRGQFLDPAPAAPEGTATQNRTIILAVEEPELYIHPQMQRLIFAVIADFAQSDQVIYSTHSPAFVDVGRYDAIAVVRKESVGTGTKVQQCSPGALDATSERKQFQFATSFGLEHNCLFFARRVVLVEGEEDTIAALAVGRRLGLFREFPEEIGVTVVQVGSKQEMPKFMKVLNGFGIPYVVLHELDGQPTSEQNQAIRNLLGGNRSVELPARIEDAVGHNGHFGKAYDALRWFERPEAYTAEILSAVAALFQ
jgi:CRISPR-associated exonuclease Cas4